MRARTIGLQTSLTTSYDQTKTTLVGRVMQRTKSFPLVGSQTVIGPNEVQFLDVFDDAVAMTVGMTCATENGRVFVIQTFTAGAATIALYNINYTTGVKSYVGRISITIPAGTVIAKAFAVDDTSSSSLKIYIGFTNTTTPANGGVLAVLNLGVSDFTPIVGATLAAATASGQKAVYFLTDTTGNNIQALNGLCLDITNSILYVTNGVAATWQVFKFNTAATISTVGSTPVAGTTTDQFTLKTGNLPTLTGVILLINTQRFLTPGTNAPAAFQGNGSIFIATTTNFYLLLASEVTSATTTLPSLATVNASISTADYTVGNVVGAWYSQTNDWIFFYTSSNQIIVKRFQNTDTSGFAFGCQNITKEETGTTGNTNPITFGALSLVNVTGASGWIFIASTASGQRGVYAIDAYSDQTFGNTYFITPVQAMNGATPNALLTKNVIPKKSTALKVQYRTGTSTSDAVFSAFPGTWTDITLNSDVTGIGSVGAVQYRAFYNILSDCVTNGPQLVEATHVYTPLGDISDNWEGSVDNSTGSSASPARSAFRLRVAYATSVPTLYFRAYDDTNTLVATANTASNPTLFEYSTNNGTSWNALGTIANVAGTTELRYNWASPPGVKVTVSLAES